LTNGNNLLWDISRADIGKPNQMQMKKKKVTSKLHNILRELTTELRGGDQITIWHNKYQLHFKNVGTSNFNIAKQNTKKNADTKNIIQT